MEPRWPHSCLVKIRSRGVVSRRDSGHKPGLGRGKKHGSAQILFASRRKASRFIHHLRLTNSSLFM